MSHPWKFFRAGGFDQPRIDTPADLLAIGELDQKLWVALSCPVAGIEFDHRTLALIDSDNDGHIRAPELIATLPAGAERALTDPYAEKPTPWKGIAIGLFILAALLLAGIFFMTR